ncbi:MAG: hypothetical protein KF767_10090 [Bdellovibrionaceae bacterium]|nr:hypothetical protein [Pseudobdellovibrionaceae bacterium]
MNRLGPAVLAVTLVASTATSIAHSAPYDDFKFGTPERIDIKLEASYAKTEGNFEKSGNTFTKLNSGSSFATTDFDFGARAEIAPRFHLYGSGRLTSAESTNTVFGTPQTKTNTGFAYGQVGTDFVLVAGRILVIPDFSFTFPIESTERKPDAKVALSEGVIEANGRIVLRVERRSYRFGGFAGVTYRDGGRSTLLPYGALFEFSFGQNGRWNIGVDARGYQSLNYDKDTDRETAIDATYFCPVNGCAKRYAAFNPSSMESNLWLRVNATPEFSFHFGGGMDWSGSNVARDAIFQGGMIYRWDYSGLRRKSSPYTPNYENPSTFEENVRDGVDQRPFQNQAPKSVTPQTQIMAPEESPAPTRRAPRRPREKTINIQDELNKTEMQMEDNSTTNDGN